MIPTIMQNAHDKEKLMDMFRAEAENNWDQFVGRLDNSGTYDFFINKWNTWFFFAFYKRTRLCLP